MESLNNDNGDGKDMSTGIQKENENAKWLPQTFVFKIPCLFPAKNKISLTG